MPKKNSYTSPLKGNATTTDCQTIYDLIYGVNNDFYAGLSTIMDAYGNYMCEVKGKWYYSNASAKINGVKVPMDETLAYAIQLDINTTKAAIAEASYFQQNPNVSQYMYLLLDDFMIQIYQKNNGNVQTIWYNANPQHFDPTSTQKGDKMTVATMEKDLQSIREVTSVCMCCG